MLELIASKVVDGAERHFVLVEEVYSEGDEPFTLFVHADHYAATRRLVERAYFHTVAEGHAYCQAHYGVDPDDWRAADEIRFRHEFAFDYRVTHRGVPQPYPLGFEGGEVIVRRGKVDHPDGPPTPVLDVSGNPQGLRWLAALLLLCAEAERYDPGFHVHLDWEYPECFRGDLSVTLRAPRYLELLRHGPLRHWSAEVDLE